MKYDDQTASIMVSIIIANYNNAQYLPECFDSILMQTYKDIEIVVVDDCSTDHSREIIQSYEAKHPGLFTPVFLSKNKGVAWARHEGILKAKGHYITTLDADDHYADASKLHEEMRFILDYKFKHNEDIIAFSNIIQRFSDSRTRLVGNNKNIAQGNILAAVMARSCMIPRDFIFLKSAYFQVGGYDHRLPIYEDWDLKIRLAAKYKFIYSGITGIVYVRHGEGLSNAPFGSHIKILKKIFRKNRKILSSRQQTQIYSEFLKYIDQLREKELSQYKFSFINARDQKNYFDMLTYWFKLIKINPSFVNPRKTQNSKKAHE